MSQSKALPDFLIDADAVLRDAPTKWLQGKAPDYSKVKLLFEKEKQNNFRAGSFPELISNLIKNWEKEASHKLDYNEWRTVNQMEFKISVNGSPCLPGNATIGLGTYNALIGDTEFYAASKLTSEESHNIFRHTLADGFAWEIIEMYSNGLADDNIVFKWRHWGNMSGQLKCPIARGNEYLTVEPSFKNIEIFGICVLKLCQNSYRLDKMEIFFNPVDIFKRIIESKN